MRRAAIQVYRFTRRNSVRKVLTFAATRLSYPFHTQGTRLVSSQPKKNVAPQILSASMQLPRYSVTALAVAVGGGIWYFQNQRGPEVKGLYNSTPEARAQPRVTTSLPAPLRGPHQPADVADSESAAESPRRTLIVENDEFYLADLLEDIPLTKEAEDPSRQVLEMLTPEQATQKLRRSEESYLVGRGRGVVRYDLVQIPSNNPIEDDHAEKIVEVPQTVTPAPSGASSSDWMFWGVFDGHRLVFPACKV